MSRRPVVEVRLPARSGRLLLAVVGATYTHLLIAVVLLVWGTGLAAGPDLEQLPTLAVSLVSAPPAAAKAPAVTPTSPPRTPPEPEPEPVKPPEPRADDAVRKVPDKKPEKKPEKKPPPKPPAREPAPPRPTPPAESHPPGPGGPAEVEAPGAASSEAGSTVGGLEGMAGVETYNQRIASILSSFIPWRRLVLPPGSPPQVLTVSFLARREGSRARVERVVVVAPSGYDAFDRAVERAVREMAVVPLPAGEPSDYLSFRFQVVLHAPGGP